MYAPRAHRRDPDWQMLERDIGAVASALGKTIHLERTRRKITLRELAERAGLGWSTVEGVEHGRVASLETYLRLGRALGLQPAFELLDRRLRPVRRADAVHAAMGEVEARQFRVLGLEVRLDEPYQHFRFGGRGDLIACSLGARSLGHMENKTELPDLQDAFGSFSAKRAYIGIELAKRFGLESWVSEIHVLAVLWTTENVRTIRRHRASFEALASPRGLASFEALWTSGRPLEGKSSTVVMLEVRATPGSPRWLTVEEALTERAPFANYAEVARALARPGPGEVG